MVQAITNMFCNFVVVVIELSHMLAADHGLSLMHRGQPDSWGKCAVSPRVFENLLNLTENTRRVFEKFTEIAWALAILI